MSSNEKDEALRPGTVVLDRYRIVSLLGRGGMGSVYRAEDQLLRHEVALKFLSPELARDARAVRSLRDEVKIARQVTHGNVCRVHDIGEVDGRPFISMEYVDGEDLVSVLRRIGRLTRDKSNQIARQLCAGLQAAHAQGVLHRDLKPANVMLDGQGNVRIADFGIAAAVENLFEGERVAGTPTYMAPELFTGTPASVQSDLYSLGLLLYELFTGRVVFQAKTMTELLTQHKHPVPAPSSVAGDVEPAVEEIILQCLDRDPERRPSSAMAVLAALPGGDPLAESIASGQTPSPELVAAAGGSGKLSPQKAWFLLGLLVVAMVGLMLMDRGVKLVYRTRLPKSGEVLADRAEVHLRALGFQIDAAANPPANKGEGAGVGHRAYGFEFHRDYLTEIFQRDSSPRSWDLRISLQRPSAANFWYRWFPDTADPSAHNIKGRVGFVDPTLTAPGSIAVRLDTSGHLLELVAVPEPAASGATPKPATNPAKPAAEAADGSGNGNNNAFDWQKLFAAAGLDIGAFEPRPVTKIPATFATRRASWQGRLPEEPNLPVIIHAASYLDRPVAFSMDIDIWEGHPSKAPEVVISKRTWRWTAHMLLILIAIGLAWDSLRRRRVDLRSAFRFGATIFALVVGFTVLTGTPGTDWSGIGVLLMKGMSHGLAVAMNLVVYYMAIEPHVRRIWPEVLISWTRLFAGDVRDPLVGHSVLLGLLVGAISFVFWDVQWLTPCWLDQPAPGPLLTHDSSNEILAGTGAAFGSALEIIVDLARESLKIFMSLVVWKLLLDLLLKPLGPRSIGWARPGATALTILTWTVIYNPGLSMELDLLQRVLAWTLSLSFAIVNVWVLTRFGLLALMVGFATFGLLGTFPLDIRQDTWFSGATWLAWGMMLVGGIYGATTAIGKQR